MPKNLATLSRRDGTAAIVAMQSPNARVPPRIGIRCAADILHTPRGSFLCQSRTVRGFPEREYSRAKLAEARSGKRPLGLTLDTGNPVQMLQPYNS